MEAALPVFTAASSLFRPQTVGMYLQRANSKLCFLLHKKFFAAENSLLARGGEKAPPKSALFDRRLRHERIVIFSNRRGKSLTSKISIMEKNRPTRKGRGGGAPRKSGLLSKAAFIKARVFADVFQVIKTDRGTLEYVAKLTQLHAQYRAIGVNYNQVVKELRIRFSERKALSLLYKLEKATMQLVDINSRIVALSEEFQKRW